jgi:hypothetical protein
MAGIRTFRRLAVNIAATAGGSYGGARHAARLGYNDGLTQLLLQLFDGYILP